MITRAKLEELKREMESACSYVAHTCNSKTREAVDKAVEAYIAAEKEYGEQRNTKVIEYRCGVRPLGDYNGTVEVFEDATDDEIRAAIEDDCEMYMFWS